MDVDADDVEGGEPADHFRSCFSREGDGEDVVWKDALVADEVLDAFGEDCGFTAAGAGDAECALGAVDDGFFLFVVVGCEEVAECGEECAVFVGDGGGRDGALYAGRHA